ncbi:MAG: hypothetical protein HKO89_02875 [Saprospiraceae bacterium]|nr:hypothetical protein [Saprospiraceae bacterium]
MNIILLVFLVLFIVTVIREKSSLKDFLRILISSSLSLIILLLIYILLAAMPQGRTLVVSVFESEISAFIIIILVNFLALILSHFPHYFDIALQNQNVPWEKTYGKWPLGLVYYKPSFTKIGNKCKESNENHKEEGQDIYLTILRRHIGLLTYIVWIGILLDVYLEVFNYGQKSTWILSAIWLALLFIQINVEVNLTREIKDPSKLRTRIKNTLAAFQFFIVLTIFFLALLIYGIYSSGWSSTNLVLMLMTSILSAILFIFFRSSRKWFIYFRAEEQKDQEDGLSYKRNPLVDQDTPDKQAFKVKEYIPLYYFSNQVNYLKAMSLFGILITIVILVFNLVPSLEICWINPIALVIMYVLIYYAIITITLKHALYYSRIHENQKSDGKNETKEFRWTGFYKRVFQLFFAFVAVLFLAGSACPSKMHFVPVEKELNAIGIHKFLDHFDTDEDNTSDKFILGSYGGGLKANSWNLILLTEIIRNEKHFLDSTLCMSGVSGGAIGLANLAAMFRRMKDPTHDSWDSTVAEIGKSNMLSTDVNGIFFRDLVFKMFPLNFIPVKDRAYESMKLYSRFTGDNEYGLNTSFIDYYRELFDTMDYFPAIIFNTTPTQSKFGVACSIDGISDFPISIDILDQNAEGESLTFYGAASTTNRFPIASPAARIEGKGYFVDGGYFENSGLLNAYHFYTEVRDSLDTGSGRFFALNIVNDKQSFIKDRFDQYFDPSSNMHTEKSSSEFSSILKGILALERMPEFARELIRNDTTIELITIYMPELYNVEDVANTYGLKSLGSKMESEVRKRASDDSIKIVNALEAFYNDSGTGKTVHDCGIVIPPTGRILSKEAFNYQMAMSRFHINVTQTIKYIDSILTYPNEEED